LKRITRIGAAVAGLAILGSGLLTVARAAPGDDPFLWLEDVSGARATAWVKEQNTRTLGVLQKDPHFAPFYADALKIGEAQDRLVFPEFINGRLYNFWQDATHVRGIWRSTTVEEYASTNPTWTTVLDLDALAKTEGKNWVWKGADCDSPSRTRCMISLSEGGEDATTMREFDLTTNAFVAGGFDLPRSKQSTAWESDDALLIAREWQPGDVTASSYAYIVKRLKRGQPLDAATEIFRGVKTDLASSPGALSDGSGHRVMIVGHSTSFFESETLLLTPSGLKPLAIPKKASLAGMIDGHVLIQISEDWTTHGTTYHSGTLLSVELGAMEADPAHLVPHVIFAPGPRQSIGEAGATRDRLILCTYDNVRGRAAIYTPSPDGSWTAQPLALPDNSSIGVITADSHGSRMYVYATGFLTPTTIYSGDADTGALAIARTAPARFDASRDVAEQHEAISSDGTHIPYFLIHPKSMVLDGSNPTILYGYGGFEVSLTPNYGTTLGKLWLERGGVYVLANIRGGGEFGPAWHEAALKTHRQIAYDDFTAVARDVIARKVTSPRRLGIMGGSNGGLLMGVEFTQHPELFHAVDIQIPLLDMLRFEHIAAGASWVGEYGTVSIPDQRAFLAKISPYNNLKPGVAYPEPFIWTTTKDDRVGPQHARKFAAKLAALHDPYLFYEVTEGGHGAGTNIKETSFTSALEYTYFTEKLMN
jgi:prolyl oligopeptidase